MIEVAVEVDLNRRGAPVDGNNVTACLEQCRRDAVDGSFDEYPEASRRLTQYTARLLADSRERRPDHTHVQFRLGLPEALFPVLHGGLQLLVGLLAGDLFPSEVNGIRWSNTRVIDLQLPETFRGEAEERFRIDRSNTIQSIRSAFDLQADEPLVAFSFKPRFGLGFDDIRRVSLEVLEAGFHLVELDTRQLALGVAPMERWISLGQEAAQVGRHRTAFSPNFSHTGQSAVDSVIEWHAAISPVGPCVAKIDGGLDGLSVVQSVRRADLGQSPPIITCYPLLKTHLSSAVGPTGWVDLLALSGVDIIYPGGRPSFADEARPIWPEDWSDWRRAAAQYDRMVSRGWPMPTVAGGIDPGQLHAYFELLGPNVAYFLGGAVALHPDGSADGARLCVDVLRRAVQKAADADRDGEDFSADLNPKLLERVEKTRYPNTQLKYFSPSDIFAATSKNTTPPRPFYRRDPT